MTGPPRYFDLVRQMKNPYSYRLSLVDYARTHGIKAAARIFQTTVPTVRKWLRRYQAQGPKGLQALSRAPHRCPHKIGGELERQVVALRRLLPTFGAQRLKREWGLPLSHVAMQRIWHEHGLVPTRRRKYQRKQDLAALKATWALFQQISAATKDLHDIPHYWPQMQARGLPPIQYTARDVRSGLQFIAFAQHRSAGASAAFAYRLQRHFQRCGVNLKYVTWQTDNGANSLGSCSPTARAPASPLPSPTSAPNTSASRPLPTPIRATWKPCIASSKTSSTTWNASAAAPSSWPRLRSTSSTSTSSAPTPTKEACPHGKSSSSSPPASPSTSACSPLPSSTIVSMPRGDTIYLDIPNTVIRIFLVLEFSVATGGKEREKKETHHLSEVLAAERLC